MEDYIKAHEFSSNHIPKLKNDKKCGFFILRIVKTNECILLGELAKGKEI